MLLFVTAYFLVLSFCVPQMSEVTPYLSFSLGLYLISHHCLLFYSRCCDVQDSLFSYLFQLYVFHYVCVCFCVCVCLCSFIHKPVVGHLGFYILTIELSAATNIGMCIYIFKVIFSHCILCHLLFMGHH